MTDNELDYFDDHNFDDECEMCGEAEQLCVCNSCGQMPDGTCAIAGSEWCDWSCPFSDEICAARISAMKKRKALMPTPRDLHLQARIFVRRWFGWPYSTKALNAFLISIYTLVITTGLFCALQWAGVI